MEIEPTLTPAVHRLLQQTFPDSLPVLYALRNGAVASLVSDDASNPSFVVAAVQRRGRNDNNEAPARFEYFVVATDPEAAARALPQRDQLGPGPNLLAVPESYVDAILRARPGTPDPRQHEQGAWLFYSVLLRSLAEDVESIELHNGARVRRLTVEDTDLVNKYWVRTGGAATRGYVANLLSKYGGYGVETPSGELVSWVLRYENEGVGMGHTMQQHRGKGYVKAAAREVLREQRRLGVETSHYYTHQHNTAMLAYADAEGYTRADGMRWVVSLD
eukprot:m51a1_g8740 putative glycine n-acyltransferase-like protein 3 (275) ;mRNA; f:32440-33541